MNTPWSHIKDTYFKDKLDKGLIKYEPEMWNSSEEDEQELIRKGVK